MGQGRPKERPRAPTDAKKAPAAPVWEGREYGRYEPGVRLVRCTGFQGPEWVFAYRRWSVRLEFALTDEEGTVSAFRNLGTNREQPRVGRHSKYAEAWCMANGGAPYKGQLMLPDVFVGKFFEVEIADCHATTGETYSKVTRIVSFQGP